MFRRLAAISGHWRCTSLKAKGKAPNISTTNVSWPAAGLRPLDQWTRIVTYEPSADGQLPMYNAAADHRVTTANRSKPTLAPEKAGLPQQPTRLTLD